MSKLFKYDYHINMIGGLKKMEVEITSMGERGQVVIPQNVRESRGIIKGDKFMVLEQGDLLILKKLETPSTEDINKMLKKGHEHAKKHNLIEDDMVKAIKKARAK